MRLDAAIALGAVLLGLGACEDRTGSATTGAPAAGVSGPAHPTDAALRMTEIALASGLVFVHDNDARGERYYAEIMGAGVGLLDYDNDGDLDVYLVQGNTLGGAVDETRRNRLFRNELVPGGTLRFVDVTAGAGVGDSGYGMGVAAGDYDRDGRVDLYVTNFGRNALLRNRGDGTFEDLTVETGADDARWSTSASFADFDADGWPDLFVANYETFTVANNKPCFHADGRRDYCGPDIYSGVPDRLLRNRGDGRFEDLSARGAINAAQPGLGVAAIDIDDDQTLEYFVANDARANHLWQRQAGGPFTDLGLDAGVAFNRDGRAEAGMGIAVGDYDGDGDEDLLVTHLATETNTLYRRGPGDFYVDATDAAGLGLSSLPFTGFGAGFADFDNDGALDLFVANGAVTIEESQLGRSDYPYAQRNQLYLNRGGRFVEVLPVDAAWLVPAEVSRGAAFGDIDNDGDTDIVISNSNGPVRLLRNDSGHTRAWIGIDLRAAGSGGEHVVVRVSQGARQWWRRARRDGSYLSSSDARVLVGLGTDDTPVDVLVLWRTRPPEIWRALASRRYQRLEPGTGETPADYCAQGGATSSWCDGS